jgi:hypothetical protein
LELIENNPRGERITILVLFTQTTVGAALSQYQLERRRIKNIGAKQISKLALQTLF